MPPQRKEPPSRDRPADDWMTLVTRPEKNISGYVNFEHARDPGFAFDPSARAFDRVNAWWAAEASFFCYWRDPEEVRAVYADRTGFRGLPISVGGTQCHLIVAPDFALVAFRGTQPDDAEDNFDNVQFALRRLEKGGHAHHGFRGAFERIKASLAAIVQAEAPNRPLWVTGHSLGAAIATMAADTLPNVAGVYTFGSPLVGDDPFARRFSASFADRTFRYVDNRDLVTRVPPDFFGGVVGRYSHVDRALTIDADGRISADAVPDGNDLSDRLAMVNIVRKMWKGRIKRVPDQLADHAPVLYVTHVWNDLLAHGR